MQEMIQALNLFSTTICINQEKYETNHKFYLVLINIKD